MSQAVTRPGTVAARLAGLVPPDSRSVFEMCRPGLSVAAQVRSRNPAIRFAILPLPDGRPFPADFPAMLGPARPQFDCLVIHDVFPDDRSPFATLGALLPHLTPGAAVLFVLARDACERLCAEGGKEVLLASVRTALTDIGLDVAQGIMVFAGESPDAGGYSHLIVQAAPAGGLQRLYLSAMTLRPAGACNDMRIDLPNAFLATVPGVRTQAAINLVRDLPLLPGERRVAVLQRRIFQPHHLPGLKDILERGYLLVAEFDDHPNHWPEIERFGNLSFRAAHAVQTSTDVLAEELRPLNPEIAVFPNQIATLPPPRPARTDGRLSLFFGAFNRQGDWDSLMEPLNRLLGEHPGRIDVQVVHDRAFFDALATTDKRFTPTCDYDGYIDVLRRCDVALLPLNDTLFNRCKSDLKFIECAAHGVVALASPTVYAGSVRDGVTGLLFHSPADFLEKLRGLVVDPRMRTAIAGRAYEYVRDHRLLAQHFRKRLSWYESLLARKEELDARLFERLPELRA